MVVGHRSSRAVSELTGINQESVRRYLGGQALSIEFLQALCKAFGVSGEWMLTGRGVMKAADAREAALRQADAGELLSALAEAVEKLIARVDRLEQLIQIVEVRVRVVEARGSNGSGGAQSLKREIEHGAETQSGQVKETPAGGGGGAEGRSPAPPAPGGEAPFGSPQSGRSTADRLAELRDALAKRPPQAPG